MDAKLKEDWIKALRSGEYQQAVGALMVEKLATFGWFVEVQVAMSSQELTTELWAVARETAAEAEKTLREVRIGTDPDHQVTAKRKMTDDDIARLELTPDLSRRADQ